MTNENTMIEAEDQNTPAQPMDMKEAIRIAKKNAALAAAKAARKARESMVMEDIEDAD